ncbi:MAG: hypothetical protein KC502_22410, partial [Myxococcales bacterium]|nr:hypothetical protein [Myxococcales bacterium]
MPALPRDLAGALVCLLLTVGCGQSPGGQSGGSGVDSAGSQVDVAADDGSDASTSHASDTQLADGVSSDSGGDDASAKVTQDSTAEIDDAAGGLSDASAQGDGEQGDGEQGDGEQGDATATDASDGGSDKGDVGATSTYVMGDCGPGAPGYNSCVIQAALACLKPVGACKLTTSGAHQST